eukprot:gene6914-5726_t
MAWGADSGVRPMLRGASAEVETEVVFPGCCGSGGLRASYVRDDRLGDVDHAAVRRAVAGLAQAFARGGGNHCAYLPVAAVLFAFGMFALGAVVMGAESP